MANEIRFQNPKSEEKKYIKGSFGAKQKVLKFYTKVYQLFSTAQSEIFRHCFTENVWGLKKISKGGF